jgi:hypothetical protein
MYFAPRKSQYFWLTVALGLVYCFGSIFILSWGRKRVDYWRDKIFEEVKETNLESIFEIYKPVYLSWLPSPRSPRFWLDVFLPIIIVLFWVFLIYLR